MRYVETINPATEERIKKYRIFESADISVDDLKGSILHLYGGIPLNKEKSKVVISSIFKDSGFVFDFPSNINMNEIGLKVHDKVRFDDYFNSLLESKSTRGDNFEGLIAGVYNGDLSDSTSSKYDITIGSEKVSVKFVDSNNEAPRLGSYFISSDVNTYQYLTDTNVNVIDKLEVVEKAFDNVDSFLFAYPIDDGINIRYYKSSFIIDRLINHGYLVAPKTKGSNDIRISSRIMKEGDAYTIKIPNLDWENIMNIYDGSKIPETKEDMEIESMLLTTDSVSKLKKIFGDSVESDYFIKRIRGDVAHYILRNVDNIRDNLNRE